MGIWNFVFQIFYQETLGNEDPQQTEAASAWYGQSSLKQGHAEARQPTGQANCFFLTEPLYVGHV